MQIQIAHYKWNRVFNRWECMRRDSYVVKPAVVQALDVAVALVQKRLQSAIPHPLHPSDRIDHACGSEDEAVQSS